MPDKERYQRDGEYYLNYAKQRNIIWREENFVREEKTETYVCKCGKVICRPGKARHERSKGHMKFIENDKGGVRVQD